MGSLNPENPPKQELDDSGYVQEDGTVKEVPAESTSPNLLDLSDDVLLCILQYCTPVDLKALGFTCSRLGTLVLDRTLWQCVEARAEPTSRRRMHWLLTHALSAHTTTLRLSGYGQEQPSWYIPVHTFCPYHPYPLPCGCLPRPRTPGGDAGKTLPESKKLSYAALLRITQVCTNLTELILEDIVIDSRVTRISMFPKSLRKLSLRGSKCMYLDEHFLDKIYDHLEYLEDLDVSYCIWLEPSAMMPLSKLSRLTRLVMQHCPKLSEFTAYASLAARYGFKQLKVLDMCGSPVGDSEVSAFGLVPSLQELYLSPAEDPNTEVVLPVFAELLPWEHCEPEYYSSKYASQQWIQEEASPGPLPTRVPNCTSTLNPMFQQNELGLPCSAYHQPQPVMNRYCPFLPFINMRSSMNHDRNEAGSSRNVGDDNRNGVSYFPRNGEGSSQNWEGNSQNDTGSNGNESDSSMCKNFDESDTKEQNDENNIDDDRKDGASKRKYEEPGNGEVEEKDDEKKEQTFSKRQRVGEVNNCDESEASCSKTQVSCSENQAGCSKDQAGCFENQAGCSKNQAGCSSYKEVDSAKEESCPTIKVSCSNGAPTIIEVDLFRNRVNASQNVTNNNMNVSRIEVDLTMNRPSSSGAFVKFGINPYSSNAEGKSSKVEPSCSKVEANSETEVSSTKAEVSSSVSSTDCNSTDRNEDIQMKPNKKVLNENTTCKTNKRPASQVNIFKESISEFKKRLLSSKLESNTSEESSQNSNAKEDSNNDCTDDNDSTKKPKLQDSKEGKKKLDYRDPKNIDLCSDTSSNCDDDDDEDHEHKIRRPKTLEVKSNNWVRIPDRHAHENMNIEERRNLWSQMIDNIRKRHESTRKRHPNVQREGFLRDLGVDGAGPSNEAANNPPQPDNNPPQPDNNAPQGARFVRFRTNQPAVVIECCREQNEPSDDNHNDARQPDWHNVAAGAGPAVEPAQAQEVHRLEPQNRLLVVNVGLPRHAIYRAAEAIQGFPGAHYPVSNYFPPTRVSHDSLVSDASIRRFGRADGENINYVQIGPRGIVPVPDPGVRPERTNLRVLSVRGYTNVTNTSLVHLVTAAPHLRLVDFSGTSVTEQGAMQFRCARPECEVRCGPILHTCGDEVAPE